MIPSMAGLARQSNGVREAERDFFEVSQNPKRDPRREKPAGKAWMVEDCLIITQQASVRNPFVSMTKAWQSLGGWVSFTKSVASSGLQSGVSVDPAGWPRHFNRVNAINRSESEVDSRL
jgi:hypothetical protein